MKENKVHIKNEKGPHDIPEYVEQNYNRLKMIDKLLSKKLKNYSENSELDQHISNLQREIKDLENKLMIRLVENESWCLKNFEYIFNQYFSK